MRHLLTNIHLTFMILNITTVFASQRKLPIYFLDSKTHSTKISSWLGAPHNLISR